MKKIIGLTLAALLVMAMIGGGTWAYFSDPEAGTVSLAAGTLNLTVNDLNTTQIIVGVTGKAPGETGSGNATIKNTGSITGYLDVAIGTITNTDGAPAGADPDIPSGTGELGGVATIAIYIDVNNNGAYDAGTDIGLVNVNNTTYILGALQYFTINSFGSKSWNDIKTMALNDTHKIAVAWDIPTSATNTIQGDTASFTITLTLEQH